MDDFVKMKPGERRLFFEGTATPLNMQPQIVEKDFWVCWTLKELFRLPTIGEHLIFKGGTSLSKVFKDYAKMEQMFFGEPPKFDPMIEALQQWENHFNRE